MTDDTKKPEPEILPPPPKPKNPALKPPWQKGQSGNPKGRAAGSKNKATLLAEQMIGDEAEQIIRKCIDMALAGDPVAMKLCVDRIMPPLKEKPVKFTLPADVTNADLASLSASVLRAVATGALTPGEATAVAGLMASHRLNIEAEELKTRLSRLETFMALEQHDTNDEAG